MPAASVTGKFTIRGDVDAAVRAATEFGKAITSINRRMTSLAGKKPQIDAFTQTLNNMNRTLTSFTRRAGSAVKRARELNVELGKLSQFGMGAAGAGMPTAPTQPTKTVVPEVHETAETLTEDISKATQLMNVLEGGVSKVHVALTAAMAVGRGVGSVIDKVKGQVSGFFSRIGSFVDSLPRAFNMFQRYMMNLTDGLRLITLGLTNMARSIMFFISIPLAGVFYGLASAVLDFDDMMKRVQKTTGLTNKQMEWLTRSLRDLAVTTPTAHAELARIAEQIGQLGVYTPESIAKLTEMANMLVVSTDITADQVGLSLGRIANAFGLNLNKSTDEIWRTINVINILENETAATANQIVEATLKFAPIAAMMNLAIPDTIAFAASLDALGYEASEAGTALRNIGVYMVKNIDDVQALMANYAKYRGEGVLAKEMTKDFTGTLIDFLKAASKDADWIKVLGEQMEVLNLRGGRGAASLTKNLDQLIRNLEIARKEWESGESILREYDRQLSSTKSQIAILRNNLVELGITVGDVVLPVINKLVQFLIPLVQMATEWFAKLDRKTQLLIVGFTLLTVVGGPLLMFIAQMIHGLFLMGMGLSTLLRLIPTTLTVLIGFGRVAGGLLSVFKGWPVIIAAAMLIILRHLQSTGVDIAGFFIDLADQAETWGESLAATFASGLLSGAVRWIGQALSAIGNFIASFLRGGSPPEQGPLSTIDKWGRNLMRTFLEGFLTADFNILKDVAGVIGNILSNLAYFGDVGEAEQFEILKKVRVKMAELISIFNETGKVSKRVLNEITAHLGDLAGDVQDLIEAWFEYNRIQRELEELERRRERSMEMYEDELKAIQQSNMSAEEKVAAIRAATRAHHDELESLDEEQEALEEQEKQAKDNLTWQQQFLDALITQDDLQRRLLETLERLAKAAEDLAGAGGEIEPFGLGEGFEIPEPSEEAQRAIEALYDLPNRINMAREALKGLFAGLTGKGGLSYWELMALPPEVQEDYHNLYVLGVKIRDIWINIRAILDGIAGIRMGEEEFMTLTPGQQTRYNEIYNTIDDVRVLIATVSSDYDKLRAKIFGGEGAAAGPTIVETLKTKFRELFETIVNFFTNLPVVNFVANMLRGIGDIEPLRLAWEELKKTFEGLTVRIREGLERIGGIEALIGPLKKIGGLILELWHNFGGFFGFILGIMLRGLMIVISTIISVASWVLTLGGLIAEFILDLATGKGLTQAAENFSKGLDELVQRIVEFFDNLIKSVDPEGKAAELIQGMCDGINESWANLRKAIKELFENLLEFIKGFLGIESPSTVFYQYAVDVVLGFINGLSDKWTDLMTRAEEKLNEMFDFYNAVETLKRFLDSGKEWVNNARDGISTAWQDLMTRVGAKLEELWNDLTSGDTLAEFYNAGVEWLSQIWSGFLANWGSFVSDMLSRATKIANDIIDMIRNAFDSHSPSREFQKIARDLGLGFIKGLDLVSGEITLAYKKYWNSLAPTPRATVGGLVPALAGVGALPAEAFGGGAEGRELHVHVHNPVVREEQDIDRIADAVYRKVNKKVIQQNRYGGSSGW
jgi:TP901 family phage tail tape measure protein